MKQYLDLLRKIRDEGVRTDDRTGTGRCRIFETSMRFDLTKGEFPLVTTKFVYTKGFIEEMLWFIKGDTNVKTLKDKNVNIWNSWAVKESDLDAFFDKMIKPFVEKHLANSNITDPVEIDKFITEQHSAYRTANEHTLDQIGPMYGAMWRNAPGSMFIGTEPPSNFDMIPSDKLERYKKDFLELYDKDSKLEDDPKFMQYAFTEYMKNIDQLQTLILNLKRDPYSARHLVTALIPEYRSLPGFSPQENVLMGRGALDPCHMFFKCFVYPPKEEGGKKRLSLSVTIRSCDFPIGTPFNIAQYALLTYMIAHVTDMEPYEFIFNGGDTHIYLNQLDMVEEQLAREPQPLPKLWLNPEVKDLFQFTSDDIKILDYNPLPKINYPVSV